ncbi:17654_t:CDS:2, partial [Gigaspora margarita]
DAPELTRQIETNLVFKIKNLVPKNNIEKLNNSKGKDKADLQETYIQKQEKKSKQPLYNKENKNKNSRNSTKKENRKEDKNKKTSQINYSLKDILLDILKIGVQNINRLKLDEEKLQMLADQCNRDKMDIIGITETNIGEKKVK